MCNEYFRLCRLEDIYCSLKYVGSLKLISVTLYQWGFIYRTRQWAEFGSQAQIYWRSWQTFAAANVANLWKGVLFTNLEIIYFNIFFKNFILKIRLFSVFLFNTYSIIQYFNFIDYCLYMTDIGHLKIVIFHLNLRCSVIFISIRKIHIGLHNKWEAFQGGLFYDFMKLSIWSAFQIQNHQNVTNGQYDHCVNWN